MQQSISRRDTIFAPFAVAASAAVGGCFELAAMQSASGASSQPGSDEVAYVFLDVHQRAGDRIGNLPTVPTLFVNTHASPNPLWVHTPDRQKLNTARGVAGTLFVVEPGTYRMVQFSIRTDIFKFSLAESPVEFTVEKGDSAYVGSLQTDIRVLARLNYLDRMRQLVTMRVADAFEVIKPVADRALAHIPGAAPVHFHPMTILRPSVELGADQLL